MENTSAPKNLFGSESKESSITGGSSTPFGGGTSSGTFVATPTTKSTAGETVEDDNHKIRLIRFYEKHNPSKIDSVDATLEKYKGKEEELFRKLEAKYAPQPKVPKYPPPAGTGPRCFLEFSVGNEAAAKRVVVKLYQDKAPLAAENFRCLCTGEITTRRAAGKPLRYLGSKVHRIVPGFCLQAGDFTTGNGRGGASIYPPNSEHGDAWGKFKDEPTGFLDHSRKGLLSMANSGKNTNSSQFFFTLKAVPYLNGKHVVFGEVEEGMNFLEELSRVETDPKTSRPIRDVVISSCGEIDAAGTDRPSVGSGDAPTEGSPAATTPFGMGGSTMFGGGGGAFGSGASTSKGGAIFGGSTTGGFGAATAFGQTSALGGGSGTSVAAPTGTTAPVFGTPSALGGSNSTSGSGSGNKAPSFGSPSPLGGGFGSSGGGNNKVSFGSGEISAFGSTTTSASTAGPVFGTTSAFGTTGGFGARAAASTTGKTGPVFGTASAFGSSTGGGAAGGFGALAASASASSSPFGGGWGKGSGGSAFGSGGGSSNNKPSIFGGGSNNNNKPSIFGGSSGGKSAFASSPGTANDDDSQPSPFSAFARR